MSCSKPKYLLIFIGCFTGLLFNSLAYAMQCKLLFLDESTQQIKTLEDYLLNPSQVMLLVKNDFYISESKRLNQLYQTKTENRLYRGLRLSPLTLNSILRKGIKNDMTGFDELYFDFDFETPAYFALNYSSFYDFSRFEQKGFLAVIIAIDFAGRNVQYKQGYPVITDSIRPNEIKSILIFDPEINQFTEFKIAN